MTKVPKNLQNDSLSEYLKKEDFKRIHQGKVRDTYFIDKKHLLVVASDRISIFDFVLNALIPKKGEVLTALTHFWLTKTLTKKFQNHLVQSENSELRNAAFDLRSSSPALPIERCLVVKNLIGRIYPFELIFRHHLGGSVFKPYEETGIVGGHVLPPSLQKWSKLEKPIFTPSTKEDVGHDVNIDADYFFKEMKKTVGREPYKVVNMLAFAYELAYAYAEEKGILIFDTKFEVAGTTIVDEFITPDSSRFALKRDWEKAMREKRDPSFLDKQPVRDWGNTIETPFFDKKTGEKIIGINNLNPKNSKHVDFVHSLIIPKEIIKDTTERYLNIFELLTEYKLEEYQFEVMGV